MSTKTSNINIRNIDSDLKRDIKVAAASDGSTIQDWVIRVLADKLGKPLPRKRPKQ